ncbi:MAG: outer membrane lipoprotein-sorting protein [Crocinitomicaceae bacterium]|nr:outer membrane lipoprotein-sorting protein [Crocinitomicaceae bacterium]
MKKLVVGALFIASSFFSIAQDITVEEIVGNYIENVGGVDAWNSLEGHKMVASAAMQGMDIPVEVVSLKDGRKITKYSVQGQELVQDAYDGETLWAISFMTMKAEKMESEDTENYTREMGEFPDALMTYAELGYTLELDGEDSKDGVDCYKLKLTKNTQLVEGTEVENVVYYYIDKENFIPIVVETTIMAGEMKGQVVETLFSDYQEVEGLYFPFAITNQTAMGSFVLQIESIELNPEVEDEMFAYPAE